MPSFICVTPDVDGTSEPVKPPALTPGGLPLVGATLDPQHLWTQSDGATPGSGLITLDVAFLNGTRDQRRLVGRIAPQWTTGALSKRIAFRFGARPEKAHIRLRFGGRKGNLSEVGRKNLDIPVSRETMNLDDVDQRGILHEFGHVLGLRHEHQHPRSGIVWNKPVVLAALGKYGWSKAKVEENIFDHFSKDCSCPGDEAPDPHSVMLYSFPPEWTRGGHATPLNTKISTRDRRCLERVYGA
jgi:hypothetical protein